MQLKIDFEKKQLTVIDVLNLKSFLKFIEKFIGEEDYVDWVFMPEKNKEHLAPIIPLYPSSPPSYRPYDVTCIKYTLPTTRIITSSSKEKNTSNETETSKNPLTSKQEAYIASIEELHERVPVSYLQDMLRSSLLSNMKIKKD